MKSRYDEENIESFQYGKQSPAIEFIKLPKDKRVKVFTESNQIIFVGSGVLTLFNERTSNKNISTGESVLVPMKGPRILKSLEDSTVFVIKLSDHALFHEYLPAEFPSGKNKRISMPKRREKSREEDDSIGFLKSHQRMIEFATAFENCEKDGIKDTRFFDLKLQEFLLLIQRYYTKQQINNFFAPIHTLDFIFSAQVYKNFEGAKTIQELADRSDYSLSGFEKKFSKVFGTSPYKWLQEQRAKKTYYEVCYTPKTFTKIAEEHGFSSPSHFNEFCKNYFGSTPGVLRKSSKPVE